MPNGNVLLQAGKPVAEARRTDRKTEAGDPIYTGQSDDREGFFRVAKIFVDPRDNEAYLADGYGNKRVAVVDADTGALKRYWGACGNKPDDTDLGPYKPHAPPAPQFRNPVHCADLSVDRLVYVCDRVNNRIQVFRTDGTIVKKASSSAARSAPDRPGTSPSQGIRSRGICSSPTVSTCACTCSVATRSRH